MENLSLPVFRFTGSIKLGLELSARTERVRLSVHDTADAHIGHDVILSLDACQAHALMRAVAAFNHEMNIGDGK